MAEFFSAIWNVIKAPVVLINFIALNWLGLLIGIGVALLIIFSIWLITKQQPNNVLCIVLILVLGIGGMFVNDMFKPADTGEVVTPEERLEDVSANTSKNWGNTNGGFTIEQIKQAQKDNECPVHDDINYTINMSDMGDFVCFWYRNGNIVENAIFIKTDNGLVYDGLLKYSCEFELNRHWYSWLSFGLDKGWYNLNKFWWNYDNENYPAYKEISRNAGLAGMGNNLVISSDGLLRYSRNNFDSKIEHWYEAREKTYIYAQDFIGKNSSKFISFAGAELIGTKDEAFRKINSYYNYLWNNYLNNKTSNIDVTDYMCVVIPEEDRAKYPVSAEFKQNNPDVDYYAVYRCDISVNLYVADCGKIGASDSSKSYVDKNKDDDKAKVDNYEVKTEKLVKLYIDLVDTANSDLSTLNLAEDNIVINFKSDDVSKDFIIDSIEDLNNLRFLTLSANKTYTYTIYSNKVIFNSFSGTISLSEKDSKITFEYKYLNDNVVLGVYLNPIGTIDESLIDLSNDPVKIILSNDKRNYKFDFTSNAQLNEKIYQLVECGEYDFTILSTKLIFAQTTGKITVSADKNLMGFNYALNQNSSPLTFKVSITTESGSGNNIKLYSEESNVLNIRDTLSNNKVYNVYITIYSKDGEIMGQFTHTHSGTGDCFGGWSANNLTSDTEYIAQLRFVDASDSTITYLSDTVTFTYLSNTIYTFNYTATKN